MSEPDDPTEATPVTEPTATVDDAEEVEEVEVETASDLGPAEVAPPVPVAADPVRTVSRRGAGVAMAACLLVGGLLGWLVADASHDDDMSRLVSSGQDAGYPPGHPGPMGPRGGGYPGPMGPGGGYPGPMGPHGGWEHGPGGHGREIPPWLEDAPDDGRRGDGPSDDDGADEDDESGTQDGRGGN